MQLWTTDTTWVQANSRNYSSDYYSPDNLHAMLTEVINRSIIFAAEVSVSYDVATRALLSLPYRW